MELSSTEPGQYLDGTSARDYMVSKLETPQSRYTFFLYSVRSSTWLLSWRTLLHHGKMSLIKELLMAAQKSKRKIPSLNACH